MVQQAIQQALESWVEAGRNREVVGDGRTYVLYYGTRFRLQHVMLLSIFAFFFGLAVVVVQQGGVGNAKMNLACLSLFGVMTLFSSIYVTYVFTSRVEIDDDRVTVYGFGVKISECRAARLATAYKSPVHESVVLQSHDGKKTRISTQFDGTQALVVWLRLRPHAALSDSILAWMDAEAPDLAGAHADLTSLDAEP